LGSCTHNDEQEGGGGGDGLEVVEEEVENEDDDDDEGPSKAPCDVPDDIEVRKQNGWAAKNVEVVPVVVQDSIVSHQNELKGGETAKRLPGGRITKDKYC